MFYGTSINTGGFGNDLPGRIAALRTSKAPTAANAMFNAPAYLKQRVTPQQTAEMNRHLADTHRASSVTAANDLQRQYDAQNAQMRQSQLGAAASNAMRFFDAGQSQQAAMLPFMSNLLQQWF